MTENKHLFPRLGTGQNPLQGRRGLPFLMLLAGYPLTTGHQDRGSSWKTSPVKGNPQCHFPGVAFWDVKEKTAKLNIVNTKEI
jgi:hypothetical protein